MSRPSEKTAPSSSVARRHRVTTVGADLTQRRTVGMSTRSSSGRRRGRRPEDNVLARRPGWLADAQAETDEMMRSLTRVAARGTPRAPAASTATATLNARLSGWSRRRRRRRPPRSPRPLRIAEYGPLLGSAAVGGDVFNEESTLPRKIRRLGRSERPWWTMDIFGLGAVLALQTSKQKK